MYRIGIDLGGTKIELRMFDPSGSSVFTERTPTPQGDYWATLGQIQSLVLLAEAQFGVTATVGVCIPGTISRDSGLVKNANSTCLIGHPLDSDLSGMLSREVRCANDADCFALSEATDGAAAGQQTVFGVILGTGVGGGIVINSQLLSGINGICGEWGHNPMPTLDSNQGSACYCGRKGCIETYLSGPGFASSAHRLFSSLAGLEAPDIWHRARRREADAIRATDDYYTLLATALASVVNVLDPDVIVLGGGLSNIEELYHRVPPIMNEHVFSDVVHTRMVKAMHGDSSGVRGAAWLWPVRI